MKSNGKKFLSALLVSSMVLTSSLGFMPRTAQAIDDASIYSYDFEYINEVTEKGNKQIVITTEESLSAVDERKISIEGNKADIGTINWSNNGKEIKIEIEGIDPEIQDYTVVIGAGALKFNGTSYQQVAEIRIDFKSYDITPGFKSVFKDEASTNEVFSNNDADTVKIFIDSSQILDVEGKTLSGEVNWTQFATLVSDEVDSVTYSVVQPISGESVREVDSKNADGKFVATYAGISDIKDVDIMAYDASGKMLDKQRVRYNFGSNNKTSFDTSLVKTFEADGYSVQDLLDGVYNLDDLLAGKSYGDLGKIKVYYANVASIIKVSTTNELAEALGKLGVNGELKGQAVKIKLDADIVLGTSVVLQHNASLMIDGQNHTISGGAITLGNDNDKIVKISNVNLGEDLTVDVGDAGEAYLTNVQMASGKNILVKSGAYSSVRLLGTTSDTMNVLNSEPVHILAGAGTVIGTTTVQGTEKVKMTSENGGLFNSINLKSIKRLTLQGETGSNFKLLTIESGLTPKADLVLGANTKLEQLVVNSPSDVMGDPTSKVLSATASNSLAAGTVDFNGVAVDSVTPADRFVNTDTSGTDPVINVPTQSNNIIRMNGTATDGLITEIDGKTITLELMGAASDRPVNIEWNKGDANFRTNVLAMIDNAILKDTNNVEALVVSSDNKTLTIQWKAGTDTALSATDKVTATIGGTMDKELFKSTIPVGTTGFDYSTDYTTLYKPAFEQNAAKTALLNQFVIATDNSTEMAKAMLSVDTTNPATMKWWDTANGGNLALTGVAANKLEYKTSTGTWEAVANPSQTVLNAAVALDGNDSSTIYLRSVGGEIDGTAKFVLREGEVWFNDSYTTADQDKIIAALNDDEVKVINLAASANAYDLTDGALAAITRTTGVKIKDYSVDSETKATVSFGTQHDVSMIDIDGNVEITATPVPAPAVIFAFDGADANKLKNSKTSMEYSLDGGTNWLDIPSDDYVLSPSELATVTAANDIKIRVKGTGVIAAGTATTFNIIDQAQPAAPTVALKAGDLTGLVYTINTANTNEWTIDGGATWATGAGALEDFTVDVAGTTISHRLKATGLKLASPVESQVFAAQAIAPVVAVTLKAGEVSTYEINTPATNEWTIDGGTTWNPGTGSAADVVIGTAGKTVEIRTKATATVMASAKLAKTYAAQVAAPAVTLDETVDTAAKFVGADTTMEFTIDGGTSWTDMTANHVAGTTTVDASGGANIQVRIKATDDVVGSASTANLNS